MIDTKNYLQGEWISNWTVENGNLSGKVKCQSHYYEEGNVQLDFQNQFEGSLSDVMEGAGDNLEDISNAIIKLIV